MPNFNLTYQNDGENEQLYYKDVHNNDLYIRSCEDFAPAIIQEKSGNPITITDAANCPIRKLKVLFEPIQEGSGDPSPDNVRPISGRDSVTVERTGKNVTVQLGQTVYGGNAEIISGQGEISYRIVVLDGTKGEGIVNASGENANTAVWNEFIDIGITKPIFYSDSLKSVPPKGGSTATAPWQIFGSTGAPRMWFSFPKTITTNEELRAYLAEHPITVCYPIAQPTAITLTPESLSTLKGENAFSTDGTSIELEYVVDTKTYIDNLINSGAKTVVKTNDEIKIIDENKGVE